MNRGLIEAHSERLASVYSSQLPRFMNRGLIEACEQPKARFWSTSLPRFMNRGLIEAAVLGRMTVRAVATSPIHESGPH